MRFSVLWITAALLAAGCGQKGPLFLRDKPPPGYKAPKPASAKPVPYPENPEDAPASQSGGGRTDNN